MDGRGRRSMGSSGQRDLLRYRGDGGLFGSNAYVGGAGTRGGHAKELPMTESPISPAEWSRDQIRQRVSELGNWFQNIDLRGVRTAPDHFLGDYPSCKWRSFAHAIPADLTGKTVLDIGC